MEKFASRQKELLQLEREAEVEEASLLLQGLPIRILCQKGVALQKLWISSQRTGLYGRTVVSLVQRNSADFPAHKITSGDIVGLIKQGDESSKVEVSGVVLEVRPSSISVAFQEDSEVIDLPDENQLAVVKLANDVTYKRLNSALKDLDKRVNSRLGDILLGEAEPSVPHQTLDPNIIDPGSQQIRFNNSNLDDSQQEAVKFALKQRELAIIHGPPGTGKTTTVVELIVQAVRCGQKILVTAPSNIAVDNLLQRLVKERVRCVRLGHPARISGDLHKYSIDAQIKTSDQSQIVRDIYKEIDDILSNVKKKKEGRGFREIKALRKELKERERKVLKEILSNAQVILGTLASSGADSPLKFLPEDHFSMIVIDECSQSLEMSCWMVVGWASKLVLAGDHQQLPPTILCKKAAKELEVTLMERMIGVHGNNVVRMLTTQYRMNQLIMQWSSDALYEGQVRAGSCVANHVLADLPGVTRSELTETVLLLIDTAGADMLEFSTLDGISKGNEGEASLVCQKVKELVEFGLKQEDMAVITPYNLQVETIRMNLHNQYNRVEVHSVDGFQGREKEVVILSLVRSNPDREVGFLAEKRRLNVAVTRARRQVIMICDTETVSNDQFLDELVKYMSDHGRVETVDLYDHLPQVDRPEDTKLAVSTFKQSDKKTSSKNNLKQKKDKKSNEGKKQSTIPSQRSEKDDTITLSIEEKESQEDILKVQFTNLIKDFLSSADTLKHLSSDLNANERRLVHECADLFDLIHESEGQGKERHIVLKKSLCKEQKNSNLVREEKKSVLPQVKNASDKVRGEKDTVTCANCLKELPKSNIELHKLRCTLKVVEPEQSKHKTNQNKAKKNKKKPKQEETEDDFDKICDQFATMNKICNFSGCKTKVVVIGVDCKFCRVRFCLSHSMAELHGCGDAAKQAARQQIQKDHKIFPGSGTQSKSLDPIKRNQVQRKLDKKIENMADSRKPKTQDKAKK